jgi:AraC-like DNA-binding protein
MRHCIDQFSPLLGFHIQKGCSEPLLTAVFFQKRIELSRLALWRLGSRSGRRWGLGGVERDTLHAHVRFDNRSVFPDCAGNMHRHVDLRRGSFTEEDEHRSGQPSDVVSGLSRHDRGRRSAANVEIDAMYKEMRDFPNVRFFLANDSPRLAIARFPTFKGQKFEVQLSNHVYCVLDRPAETIEIVNGKEPVKVKWHGMSYSFLPAGWKLEVEFLNDAEATTLTVGESWFKKISSSGLEYRPETFKRISARQSPIAYPLMNSLRQLTSLGRIEEWPLLIENNARSLAARVMVLFDDRLNAGNDVHAGVLPRGRLRKVMDFVEMNLHRPISVDELASVAALSPFHFSRAFSRSMGITPIRYVWSRRIERSKALLRNRTLSIAAISLECGFSSQSHFTTAFKREMGMTPAQYRERL